MQPQDHQDGAGEQPVPRYLSQTEVARAAGVNPTSANAAIARGLITPVVQVGRSPGFDPNDPAVKAYIARKRNRPSVK